MLSQRGVDWAWYAGGWDVALAGHANDAQFPSRPNFQPHHQPLNYFVQFAPGTAARARHLRDGGLGETARTNKFLADVEAGTLPPVRSEEHTSELQSLMSISYDVFCLKKKKNQKSQQTKQKSNNTPR